MSVLDIIQIVISILLVTAILLQQRGGGLSPVLGGGSDTFYRTRRGLEKTIFISTIVLSAVFLSLSVLNILFF